MAMDALERSPVRMEQSQANFTTTAMDVQAVPTEGQEEGNQARDPKDANLVKEDVTRVGSQRMFHC